MKINLVVLALFTISSLLFFGCSQIIDRTLEIVNGDKKNESELNRRENPVKSDTDDNDVTLNRKSNEKQDSTDKVEVRRNPPVNSNESLKREFNVIGTNKDGPYRSGQTKRIKSKN